MPRCVRTAHVFDKKWRSDDVRLQEEATFSSLLLPEKILIGLENAGYKTPSPIQLESIPVGCFGRDLLVQAKSGTGKTLVFTVIALESLSEIKYPQVLILAPTREIAIQICDVVRAVGSAFKGLTCNCFIGGISIDTDIERIHGCQIIVGTPGRLKHLISLGILATNSIRLLVMDEADVLLETNFKDDLDYIFVSLPKEKQVIATSATFPRELRSLTRQYFRKVYLARLNRNELTLLGMVHYIQVLELPKMSLLAYKGKLAALENVVTSVQFTQCLVFCNLISRVESLCYDIRNWGFTSTFISSAKEQCDRIRAIECLKRFRCKILVTSDVTSRGIDAENVDLVVNFDKPLSDEVYFHRCGRAGRYGAKGVAITFLEKDEVIVFEQMKLKHNLKAYNLPDPIPANLINLRPKENDSSNESSEEEDEDLSDDETNKDSNDPNNHSNHTTNDTKTKKNICENPSTESNGHVSSNLNGHLIESNGVNELTSLPDENIDCKLDSSEKCNGARNGEDGCVSDELSKSSGVDITKANPIPESDIVNGEKSFECASDKNNASESVTIESVKEKNSFLDYLESGPKNAQSPPALDSDSSFVYNNISTDHALSKELKSNNIILEETDTNFPNSIQQPSETYLLNNVDNASDNNGKDSNDSNQNETKEIVENSGELILQSEMLESLDKQRDYLMSSINSPSALPDSSSEKGECSNETKNKFVPNKIQLSVGRFLLDHMDNSDVNNLISNNDSKSMEADLSSTNADCSAECNQIEQDMMNPLIDIRRDLTDFYSKVYKAYRVDSISDAAFEDIKALVKISAEGSSVNSTAEISPHAKSSNKEINSEVIDHIASFENYGNFPFTSPSHEHATSTVNYGNISSVNHHHECQLPSYHYDHQINGYAPPNQVSHVGHSSHQFGNACCHTCSAKSSNKEINSEVIDHIASFENYGNFPFTSPPHEHATSTVNYGNISSVNHHHEFQLPSYHYDHQINGYAPPNQVSHVGHSSHQFGNACCHTCSAKSSNKEINSEVIDHIASFENYGNFPFTSPPHEHATSTVNYGNISSVNHHHECQLPSYHYDHQINGYAPPNQVSHVGHSSHQFGNACCHTCSAKSSNKEINSEVIDHIASFENYGNFPFTSPPHEHATSTVNYGNISSVNHHHEFQLPSYHYDHQINGYAPPNQVSHVGHSSHQFGNACCHTCSAKSSNKEINSEVIDHIASFENYGNFPFTSPPHEHATSTVNYGNISSVNHHHECQLPSYHYDHQINGYAPPNQVSHVGHSSHQFGNACCHTCSAKSSNKEINSEVIDHIASFENYGNFPFTSPPHEHATSTVNYGNISSVNHHHECQLPSYHYDHQINGYAPPNQVSHVGHSSHQFGNACCHTCSANWYQLYMKQWHFIHSSLF